jgi:ComF family protein
MAERPAFGLCGGCAEALSHNDGPRCPVCDLPGDAVRCASCAVAPFSRLRAPYAYGGSIADLVQAVKFSHREDLARALGCLLAADAEAARLTREASCIVPVPLGRGRQRSRGYNQSAVMARQLARVCGRPVRHALTRVRDTPPQSDLPLAERQANVRGAFRARLQLAGTVALVDDVVTSGETVRQAAAALADAGATTIVVVALARTPLHAGLD